MFEDLIKDSAERINDLEVMSLDGYMNVLRGFRI